MKKAEEIIKDILLDIKRKDRRQSVLNIFNLLLRLNKIKNYNKEKSTILNNYFSVPSKLLQKVNKRYNPIINILLENGIIDYYSTQEDMVLFSKSNHSQSKKKSYSTYLNESARYIFLIDTNDIEIEVYENEDNWFKTTKRSLNKIGLESKISRCSYGRRVHTPITMNMNIDFGNDEIKSYKDYFKLDINKDKYSVIDIKQSQPTFLYLLMKEKGYTDLEFFNIIENKEDIYYFIQDRLNLSEDRLEGRDKAKKLFQRFISKNEKSPEIKSLNKIFGGVYEFKNKINNGDYKKLNTLLQRKESSFFIDELFNKEIDLDFCLSVHDSFIIENKYVDILHKKLNDKYTDFEFKREKL